MAIIQFIEVLASCHSQFATLSLSLSLSVYNDKNVSASVHSSTRIFVRARDACICPHFGQVRIKMRDLPFVYYNALDYSWSEKSTASYCSMQQHVYAQCFVAEMNFVRFPTAVFLSFEIIVVRVRRITSRSLSRLSPR